MRTIQTFLAGAILTGICGCVGSGSSNGSSNLANTTITTYNLAGLVQKGPFIQGTSITVQELDSTLNPTGTSYITQTTDSLGSFSTQSSLKSPFVEVIASGYYFNEVSGKLSESTLTLRVYADLNSSSKINVNVLTSLAHDRIKKLVTDGATLGAAIAQAENEILNEVDVSDPSIIRFSQMDISQLGTSNAILLLVSSILQGSNSEAELSELLALMGTDFAANGKVTNQAVLNYLNMSIRSLNMASVQANLLARYSSLGLTVTIPDVQSLLNLIVSTQPTPTPSPTPIPTPTPTPAPSTAVTGWTSADLARLFFNANPNNPTNLTVKINIGQSQDSVVIDYVDGGTTHEVGFGTVHPYSGVQDSSYNKWYTDPGSGKQVWKGFFQDQYGAVIVIVDRVSDNGSGGSTLGGSIWFQNFNRYYPNFGVQGPLKMCWQISMGPYDCRSWITGGAMVDPTSSYYPNNHGPDMNMNYEKLGDFDGIDKAVAGF